MPAIATMVKLPSGNLVIPNMVTKREKKYPRYAPTNNEGAKFPPLPPAPMVVAVAKTLTIITTPIKKSTTHSLVLKRSNKLLFISSSPLVSDNNLMLAYPSPKRVGKNKIKTARIVPPINAFRKIWSLLL